MAEEFQGGVCGGNWWNPSRNLFGSSPCSSAINEIIGWPNNDLMVDMKATTRSSDDSTGSVSDGNSPQDVQKYHHPTMPSVDSTLQMMGISLSSSTTTDDWNQDLFNDSSRSEENYSQILQEAATTMDYRQELIPKNFYEQDSSINSFKESLQAPPFNSITTNPTSTILSNPASYHYNSALFGSDYSNDYLSRTSAPNSPMMKPLQFTNSNITPFWNGTASALTHVRPNFIPSTIQSQFVNPSSINNHKPNHRSNFVAKHHNEKARAEKGISEPAVKRPRIETPSPLPTFKVRKEKMGDRITALQQLVSPFGKTDTASVLHEAIEYIKFLHDQVSVLSTPYLKNGSPPLQRQHAVEKIKDQEGLNQDLKNRGLCLVPISSTFPVTAETTTDYWTPTFGGSFR